MNQMKPQPKNRMPKNPDLPILFAKTVLAELAGIQATIHALSDVVLMDFATRRGITKATANKLFIERRDSLTKAHLDQHLHNLGLDD